MKPYLWIAPALILLVSLVIYPMVFSLWLSFHTWFLGRPQEMPFVGLYNYMYAFTGDAVLRIAFANTVIVVIVAIVAEFALGMTLAILLSRENVRFRGVFRTCLLAPMLMTPVVVGVLWRFMFHPTFGIVNYILGLLGIGAMQWLSDIRLALGSSIIVDVWQWTPFMFLVLYAGLQSIPREPQEAARIDGASRLDILRYVVLPMMRPIITVVVIFRMIDLFKIFDIIYVLTRGGPGDATEVLTLYIFRVGLNYYYIGRAAALSWIFALGLSALAMVYVRMMRAEFRV